jgi:uncharacterized protein (TIGR03435 family)
MRVHCLWLPFTREPLHTPMKLVFLLATVVYAQGFGQTFEVASIKAAGPVNPFHGSGSMSGGPGTSDPGMFRCTCTVATLITKAFELQKYQLPGEAALPADNYEIAAKVPSGATHAEFQTMLQNLLKERFGLASHFDKKELQGYQLVVGKNGSKLKESSDVAKATAAENHGGGGFQHGGGGGGHDAGGGGTFMLGMGRYRADRQTTEELAHVLSNQIGKPVEDQTGLTGKYDIALSWAAEAPSHDHQDGGGAGRGGGDGHRGGPSASDDVSGMTVFDAVQSQLGLKLVASKKSSTRLLIVEHVDKAPTVN